MLTGMLQPSSGDAIIHGMSITRDMSRIRDSLGVCPQVCHASRPCAQILQPTGSIAGLGRRSPTASAIKPMLPAIY